MSPGSLAPTVKARGAATAQPATEEEEPGNRIDESKAERTTNRDKGLEPK